MISALVFVIVAALLCLAVVLAVLATTDAYYLSSARAIGDDGLPRGAQAPSWSLHDAVTGAFVSSPPRTKSLQLIMFTSHSLKSFPSLVDGLRALRETPDLEIIVLMHRPSSLVVPLLEVLGLGGIRVVTGSSALYGRYNVRVNPFAMFVDGHGRVRSSSFVNHDWQLETMWRLANIEPTPDEYVDATRSSKAPHHPAEAMA